MKIKLIFAMLLITIGSYAQDLEEINEVKDLKEGWNLIGYYGNNLLDIDSALYQIWEKVETVKNAEGFYLKGQPSFLNSLNHLKMADGYLVRVTETCQLKWTILRYNYAPAKPFNNIPQNQAIDIDSNPILSWNSSDSENEQLAYTILLDINAIPTTIIANNITIDSLIVSNLIPGTTYYWQVIVRDEYGHVTTSDVFSFTTKENHSPIFEENFLPQNDSINTDTTITIKWKCSDIDNETITYTVYVDKNNPPTKIYAVTKIDSLQLNTLDFNTTYYWKVVASDLYNLEVESDIMHFKTKAMKPITGTLVDIDGNTYSWVQIGQQKWMAENLRVTRYANGTPIAFLPKGADWDTLSATGKAYCFYDTIGKNFPQYKKEIYGALYSWAAASGGKASNSNPSNVQGVCPTGWHLPSETEWNQLMFYLAANGYNYNNTVYKGNDALLASYYAAKSLASQTDWSSSIKTGAVGNLPELNNPTGFNALPGGYREIWGGFTGIGNTGIWWSTYENASNNVWSRLMDYDRTDFYRSYLNIKRFGFSVRCVKNW